MVLYEAYILRKYISFVLLTTCLSLICVRHSEWIYFSFVPSPTLEKAMHLIEGTQGRDSCVLWTLFSLIQTSSERSSFNSWFLCKYSLTNITYAKQARSIVNIARVNEDPKAKLIRGELCDKLRSYIPFVLIFFFRRETTQTSKPNSYFLGIFISFQILGGRNF